MLPFKIKICGLTDPANVVPTVEAGAQAIGLNFYQQSKRYLDSRLARLVAAKIPEYIARVGVFVNASIELVIERTKDCGLDFVQLHGDETPAQMLQIQHSLMKLPDPPSIIKAIRLQHDPEIEIGLLIDECRRQGVQLGAVLVDAFSTTDYGGTGARADWTALGKWKARRGVPLILAGGINPKNAIEAIHLVRPDALDTASGVESTPGFKDPELVHRLVEAGIIADLT
jgi:phosphoribosylanthranilate isomerase